MLSEAPTASAPPAYRLVELPLERLSPAEWNANRVPPGTLRRIRRSIELFGFCENLVVRPVDGDRFEVLSGNHRLGILRELGRPVAPCVVVDVSDGWARVLAQTLNRSRGTDDPEAYAQLLADVLAKLPVGDVLDLLPETAATLERSLAGLGPDRTFGIEKGYGFHGVVTGKLGWRLVAAAAAARRDVAVEAFAGSGEMSRWYAQLFGRVVRNDLAGFADLDANLPAESFLRDLLDYAPFDLLDLDDEGCPWRELDATFETLAGSEHPSFVLSVTDGYALGAKIRAGGDLQRFYRWPTSRRRADARVFAQMPALVEHGVVERAREAGYTATRVALAWRKSKSAVYGSWIVEPRP